MISSQSFHMLQQQSPRRKRFADSTSPSLNPGQEGRWYQAFLNVRFIESIDIMLFYFYQLNTHRGQRPDGGFYYGITDDQYPYAQKFVQQYQRTVFLRSLLPCMVALDMNFEQGEGDLEYTAIGHHEHLAKEENNADSIVFLTEETVSFILKSPPYSNAAGIVAMPPGEGSQLSLCQVIARAVAQRCNIQDLSSLVRFTNKNKSMQNEAASDKWNALENSGLQVNPAIASAVGNNFVIVFDDLYQSGASMHYLAMRLQQAGLQHILGLALAKSRRDNDNLPGP